MRTKPALSLRAARQDIGDAMDWQHIAETIGSNLFMAGVVYGTFKAKLTELENRDNRQQTEIDRAHDRIDEIFHAAK